MIQGIQETQTFLAIHTSIRIERPPPPPASAIVVIAPRFKVRFDREFVPCGGRVLTMLYLSKQAQMLKAYWMKDIILAERVIVALPHPACVIASREQQVCKAKLMSEMDWPPYREEWVAMNEQL